MKEGITVEAPRGLGEETEFFLQSAPASSPACKAHIHNAVELLYVNEGSYFVTLDDESYTVEKGDLILFRSAAVHHVMSGEASRNSYYVIKIPPSFFIGFSGRDTAVRYSMRFALNGKNQKCLWRRSELQGGELQRILDALINEYEAQRYASEVAMKLKIMELLLEILRDGREESTQINDRSAEVTYNVMSYVQKNYAEDIDEKSLARSFGMSYSYFSRSFKRVTGMTFREYLNRTRISKAEQLLLKTDISISEVAIACGYNSISYFISIYRTLTGRTPYQAKRSVLQRVPAREK